MPIPDISPLVVVVQRFDRKGWRSFAAYDENAAARCAARDHAFRNPDLGYRVVRLDTGRVLETHGQF